jgi:N-acetylglucosamine-6-phosphate deacetylase
MATVLTHMALYTGETHIPDAYLRFDRHILASGPMSAFQALADDDIVDVTGKIVVPGFIDVHAHGGYGFDTMDADAQRIHDMVEHMITEGVTTVFPTTMTQTVEHIEQALIAINEAAQTTPAIGGVHLEGPFINEAHKGAQPAEYIITPDVDLLKRWYALSGERLKLVTYAPEQASPEFERFMHEHHIVPSMGHSNATNAILTEHTATHATHLYNAQLGLHHREPGVTGYALLNDDVMADIIVDGHHVVPDMVEMAFRLKGANGLELITDSMRAKGMGDGDSELGGQAVTVKDKQARLADGSLAGSVLTYDDAFKNIQTFTSADIQDAVQMSSVNQAREFNLPTKGGLQVGKDADLNILTTDMQLVATYSYGQRYQRDED